MDITNTCIEPTIVHSLHSYACQIACLWTMHESELKYLCVCVIEADLKTENVIADLETENLS